MQLFHSSSIEHLAGTLSGQGSSSSPSSYPASEDLSLVCSRFLLTDQADFPRALDRQIWTPVARGGWSPPVTTLLGPLEAGRPRQYSTGGSTLCVASLSGCCICLHPHFIDDRILQDLRREGKAGPWSFWSWFRVCAVLRNLQRGLGGRGNDRSIVGCWSAEGGWVEDIHVDVRPAERSQCCSSSAVRWWIYRQAQTTQCVR